MDDLLARRDDAERIIRFVTNEISERRETGRVPSYVLNLDAQWGQGKTFFLQRLKKHLESDGHKVAVVNAWEDDHADDPLVALVSALDKVFGETAPVKNTVRRTWGSLQADVAKLVIKSAEHALLHLVAKALGDEGAEDAKEAIQQLARGASDQVVKASAEKLIKAFEEKKKAADTFRRQAGKLADNESLLFVLVDELDRCRPTYAILLLERIKHLFETDNVVFIVATDTEQLGCAIKAVYGQEFDSRLYLKRFFTRTYIFPDPALERFIDAFFAGRAVGFREKLSSPNNNDHCAIVAGWAREAVLSLRDIEQCLDLLKSMVALWNLPIPLALIYAFPLIIIHHRGERDAFRKLARLEKPSDWKALAPTTDAHEFAASVLAQVPPTLGPVRGPLHLLLIYIWLARHPVEAPQDGANLSSEANWIENCFRNDVA